MPEASTGPPAVGSPRIPFPPPPAPATLTGVVVFSQPATPAAAPAVSARLPARASRERRESPPELEDSFKVSRSLLRRHIAVKGRAGQERLERSFSGPSRAGGGRARAAARGAGRAAPVAPRCAPPRPSRRPPDACPRRTGTDRRPAWRSATAGARAA